jgi:6-phosphogluconate dehydrogenase
MITALQDDYGIFPGCPDDVKNAGKRGGAFVETRETTVDIAVVGAGALGRRLSTTLADRGWEVVVHDPTPVSADDLRGTEVVRTRIAHADSIGALADLLVRPRKVILATTPGRQTDTHIEHLLLHLESGDVIVDVANSHFVDTSRRLDDLRALGVLYVGAGIAACTGEGGQAISIMPGGDQAGWSLVREIFESIATRGPTGAPCAAWIGGGGAGHFVKMVHNGVEYAEMQLISEAYQLLGENLGLDARELSRIFAEWDQGELSSYLLAITSEILAVEDEDGAPLLDKILDTASQLGTGAWMVRSSLELGVPATLVGEAVHARSLSALKDERVRASEVLTGPDGLFEGDRDRFVEDVGNALVASRIVAHAQAHMLMRGAEREYGWRLDYAAIAAAWHGGCILRSALLEGVRVAFADDAELPSLILDARFRSLIDRCQASWRRVVGVAAKLGTPVPGMSAALAFYDGYRSERLPANLIQAQRDYFAAHPYQRVDRERGLEFNTDWTGDRSSRRA